MHSKKHLKFKSLIESVKKEFNKIEDKRGKNKSNSISTAIRNMSESVVEKLINTSAAKIYAVKKCSEF